MTTAPAPNPRASLLSGLRTGGVRSSSASIPHTAAPGATFNIPRFSSQNNLSAPFNEDDEDQLLDLPSHKIFQPRQLPMTAAVDGPNNRFASQQTAPRPLNPNSIPFSPALFNQSPQIQMQMLQLEMMKLQTIQAQQQMQADLLAHVQLQQQQAQLQNQSNRRTSLGQNPPATAGPTNNSFDLRSATLNAQMRRVNLAEQMKAQLGVVSGDDQVPMTAALGGKFGSRNAGLNATGNVPRFAPEDDGSVPPTPNSTTVISGGTSLGVSPSNSVKNMSNPPSKSDSATSWRRSSNNNSVLNGLNRVASSPVLKVTPPPSESHRASPPLNPSAPRFRPQPLRFSAAASTPLIAVTIDSSDSNDNDDDVSSGTTGSHSSPTTPVSSASNETSLSQREEASRKLYEGLGIGRPASAVSDTQQASVTPVVLPRMVSQPTRQPRGPPSGADELGPKNFATRIRRKAIGGLGALMDARERRELVEAF
ncbi:hypothetical protein H0H93_000431 [Arthromyces matolae]|nr:hypothetical protein H0H93_000431 [Arthromyces matolae]